MSVKGTLKETVPLGGTILKVEYPVSSVQSHWVQCRVGGLENPYTDGCYDKNLPLSASGVVVTPTAIVNKNKYKLQVFSTSAREKMYEGCAGCPYKTYKMFYDYYGDYAYADTWVTSALSATKADFDHGDADFATYSDSQTRREAVMKGVAYMNVWMYVIREFEDAIHDCHADCINCNDPPVHAWDEGVAFYTGSLVDPDGAEQGVMPYALAEKRCQNFRTCGPKGISLTGKSNVNIKLGEQFVLAQHKLLVGECSVVPPILNTITSLMTVPLIQGTLRYAHKMEYRAKPYDTQRKEAAEGATFAAAVLPMVHHCSAADASIIYDNMGLGASSTDFEAVKDAFERNYRCLNITCGDVGGLWDTDSNMYYSTSRPCVDVPAPPPPRAPGQGTTLANRGGDGGGGDALPSWGIAIIVVVVILFIVISVILAVVIFKEKQGAPVFLHQVPPAQAATMSKNGGGDVVSSTDAEQV